MSLWQSTCDFPVCSMHTSTGDSVSGGYTSSSGPGVTVGLEISPGYRDQIVASVVGRCAQYAGAPRSVMPAPPTVAQLAPTTTTGNVTPPGGADVGCRVAAAEWPRTRSNNAKPIAATAMTTIVVATERTRRRCGLTCVRACRGPSGTGASIVASSPT